MRHPIGLFMADRGQARVVSRDAIRSPVGLTVSDEKEIHTLNLGDSACCSAANTMGMWRGRLSSNISGFTRCERMARLPCAQVRCLLGISTVVRPPLTELAQYWWAELSSKSSIQLSKRLVA